MTNSFPPSHFTKFLLQNLSSRPYSLNIQRYEYLLYKLKDPENTYGPWNTLLPRNHNLTCSISNYSTIILNCMDFVCFTVLSYSLLDQKKGEWVDDAPLNPLMRWGPPPPSCMMQLCTSSINMDNVDQNFIEDNLFYPPWIRKRQLSCFSKYTPFIPHHAHSIDPTLAPSWCIPLCPVSSSAWVLLIQGFQLLFCPLLHPITCTWTSASEVVGHFLQFCSYFPPAMFLVTHSR